MSAGRVGLFRSRAGDGRAALVTQVGVSSQDVSCALLPDEDVKG